MAENSGDGEKYTLIFSPLALEDLMFHKRVGNRATIKRIDRILKELEITPFVGIGNPHELLHSYAGSWSRHLNKKDVMIYKVKESEKNVEIYSARFHYTDK